MSLKKKIKSKWFVILNVIIFSLIVLILNTDKVIDFFGGNYKESKNIYVYDNVFVYDEFKTEFNKLNIDKKYNYKLIHKSGNYNNLKKTIKDNIILVIDRDDSNYLKADTYSLNGLSSYTKDLIVNSLNTVNKEKMLNLYGINSKEFESITKPVNVNSNIINKTSNGDLKTYLAIFILILLVMPGYFLITNLVQMIGSEINEEKTTRSMEIVISNVKAKDHLISKVVSCTVFTIFQGVLLVLYVLLAVYIRYGSVDSSALSSYSSIADYSGVNSSAIINEVVNAAVSSNLIDTLKVALPVIVVFFIFTLISYAILSGVLASMSTNIDNFQQLQIPITILMAFGLYLSFNAVLYDGSTFIKVMSFVPMLSFLIAPSLYLLEQISFLSLLISLIIQVIFTAFLYHYGLRIYKTGILNYQSSHLFRRIMKALASKD